MIPILEHIGAIIRPQQEAIDAWFDEQYRQTQPFFYSSVDIRHSGYKMAPVDTNLFPAGFNLLSQAARARAVQAIQAYIQRYYSGCTKMVLVPENHTRNSFYLENVYSLQTLLEEAGMEVRLGGLAVEEITELTSASGHGLTLYPLRRDGKRIEVEGFVPDVVLVNNDLSAGAPEILRQAEQPVIPPVEVGWYRRKKTAHFDTYAEVARTFAQAFEFDPWLIAASFTHCGTVNFKERTGLECMAKGVERCLRTITHKYQEYGISETPYVFIKADSGTYGMGIMTVSSPEEVMEINKKERNKMNAIKEGVINSDVIIQEGIPTVDKIGGNAAEPMLYLIDGHVVGCTYRVNEQRNAYGNLNSRGMTFNSACDADSEAMNAQENLCPVQSLVARLASLAATRECYEHQWVI